MELVNSKTKSKTNKRLLSNWSIVVSFFFSFQACSQSINNLISQISTHPWNKSLFLCLNISRDCWFSPPQSPFLSKAPFWPVPIPSSKKLLPKNTLRYSQGMLHLPPTRDLHLMASTAQQGTFPPTVVSRDTRNSNTRHDENRGFQKGPKGQLAKTLINKIRVLISLFSLQNFLFGSWKVHWSHDRAS